MITRPRGWVLPLLALAGCPAPRPVETPAPKPPEAVVVVPPPPAPVASAPEPEIDPLAPPEPDPEDDGDDSVRITDSGLSIRDVMLGSGPEATFGTQVVVHYEGWLVDGTMFDSSRKRGRPFTFDLGRKQVIKGWEEGIVGMRVGGVRRLVLPPALAYGDRGAPPKIPPKALLEFEIELLEVR